MFVLIIFEILHSYKKTILIRKKYKLFRLIKGQKTETIFYYKPIDNSETILLFNRANQAATSNYKCITSCK